MYRFFLNALILFIVTIPAFGQETLEKDLSKSFKKFELLNFDNRVLLEKAKSNQEIKFQAYGRVFGFVLTPNDLRAPNYKAIESFAGGVRALERGETTTYKGKLNGDSDSEVRLTVTQDGVEGLIFTGDNHKFFITRADKFSSRAQKSDSVVYNQDDLIKTVDLSHDTKHLSPDVQEKVNFGLGIIDQFADAGAASGVTEQAATVANLRTIEIATEADYQWVTQAGGATAANNEILSILNLVDGIYRRDLNLTIRVTYQHAWTTSDP